MPRCLPIFLSCVPKIAHFCLYLRHLHFSENEEQNLVVLNLESGTCSAATLHFRGAVARSFAGLAERPSHRKVAERNEQGCRPHSNPFVVGCPAGWSVDTLSIANIGSSLSVGSISVTVTARFLLVSRHRNAMLKPRAKCSRSRHYVGAGRKTARLPRSCLSGRARISARPRE